MSKNPIGCPVCHTPMQKRFILDGLEIDFCDLHGVWFDSEELERLMSACGSSVHPARMREVGKSVAKGFGGAVVMGAGFHLGRRLVGGILDALFNQRK